MAYDLPDYVAHCERVGEHTIEAQALCVTFWEALQMAALGYDGADHFQGQRCYRANAIEAEVITARTNLIAWTESPQDYPWWQPSR